MATACAPARTAVYRRRRPERTVLYRTVQTHLATWFESPVTVGRALRVRRMWSGSSAALSTAGFSPMVLPSPEAPSAVTIFSSPGHAKVVVSVPLATPGEWSKPLPIWPTPFFRRCRSASGCCWFPSVRVFPLKHDPAIETLVLRISRDCERAFDALAGAAVQELLARLLHQAAAGAPGLAAGRDAWREAVAGWLREAGDEPPA